MHLVAMPDVIIFADSLWQIWEKSSYDAETDEWTVPSLKPRKEFEKVVLPSLGGGGGGSRAADDFQRKKEKSAKGSSHEHR